MSKLFSKLGMGEKTARNFITILLIAAGGAIIYGLPYSGMTTMTPIWRFII